LAFFQKRNEANARNRSNKLTRWFKRYEHQNQKVCWINIRKWHVFANGK